MGVLELQNGWMMAYLFDTYSQEVDSKTDAAALQVALWEVLAETDEQFDVGAGYFSISGNNTVTNAANALLADLPASYWPETQPTVLTSPSHQDILIGQYGNVPEPASLATLGAAGVGLLIRRRR
jgi:hypothetical protein